MLKVKQLMFLAEMLTNFYDICTDSCKTDSYLIIQPIFFSFIIP